MTPPVTAKTKRQVLGELIAFNRAQINISKHNLADKTRSTIKEVERWERGDLCPTSQEWQRMRAVFPPLSGAGNRYREVFDAAAAEQRAIEDAREHKAQAVDADADADAGNADLDTMVRMLMESMPGLRSLHIEVDDDGVASVSYRTREVRIIEDAGNMQVRTK